MKWKSLSKDSSICLEMRTDEVKAVCHYSGSSVPVLLRERTRSESLGLAICPRTMDHRKGIFGRCGSCDCTDGERISLDRDGQWTNTFRWIQLPSRSANTLLSVFGWPGSGFRHRCRWQFVSASAGPDVAPE